MCACLKAPVSSASAAGAFDGADLLRREFDGRASLSISSVELLARMQVIFAAGRGGGRGLKFAIRLPSTFPPLIIELFRPTAGNANVFPPTPPPPPTAESDRFGIISPRSASSAAGCAAPFGCLTILPSNEKEMEVRTMTAARLPGNAAEENNFRSVSCPRDAPEPLRRHQQPRIAAVFCVSVRITPAGNKYISPPSFFLFIPSTRLGSVCFHGISRRRLYVSLACA